MRIVRVLSPWIVLALVAGACAAGTPAAGPTPRPELECESQDYPCSLSEVPLEILERSIALSDQVQTMLEDGGTTSEAKAWLKEQDGLAEVQADEQAIRFRLDGGRGVWVLTDEAWGPGGGDEALSAAYGAAAAGSSVALAGWAPGPGESGGSSPDQPGPDPTRPRLAYVVAPDAEKKRGLVLSPFLWDFGADDDGAAVSKILGNTRGYQGGVTYLANADKKSTGVGVQDFKGWGQYDVIHVSSHGTRICDDKGCRAMIATGETGLLAAISERTEPGLEVRKSRRTGLLYLLVTADFFRSEYPGGLSDALVYISACETYGLEATDLGDAIRGSTSVYLGWSQPVDSAAASKAAVKFYALLSDKGLTAGDAYAELGDLRSDPKTPAVLMLSQRAAGGDLRIREVVWLLHPVSGEPLSAGDKITIDGVLRDGKPDAVPFLVRVDGITPQDAAKAVLHVSVDGVEAEPVPVATGQRNDLDQWRIGGLLPLKYDLEEEKIATHRAWVELPSGGESDQEIAPRLTATAATWQVDATWEYTNLAAGGTGIHWTATGQLVLGQVAEPETPEGQLRFEVMGGTWTWGPQKGGPLYEGCFVSSTTVSVDLAADPSSAEGSYLILDTTTSPVTYWGILTTIGPDATVSTTQCFPNDFYNGNYQHHTRVNWLGFGPDERQPVGEGPLIMGSETESTKEFISVLTWTIRPLE